MVRFEVMKQFGYYVTESSRHFAEYTPYFIKKTHPELVERFNIPINAYIINSRRRNARWDEMKQELVLNTELEHERSKEYASYLLEAMETDTPYLFNGNVLNTGLIPNLPSNAIVEVPCVADGTGIRPCYAGSLPEHLAGLCRSNVNMQLLAIEACMNHRREDVYYAAMLDPRAASELSIDEIKALCDEMIAAHGDWLPRLR
jgi:alpha-galactosidase